MRKHSRKIILAVIKASRKGIAGTEISKGFHVPYGTLQKWFKIYREKGLDGFDERPRGIQKSRIEVPEVVQKAVIETSRQYPGYGVKKISGHLRRWKFLKICGETVRKILGQEEAKETANPSDEAIHVKRAYHRRRRQNKPPKEHRFERSTANSLWQMDIMTYMLKNMYRVYVLWIIDDYSRYIVHWGVFRSQNENNVLEVVRGAIEKNGCPKEFLTDNGRQFCSWRGKTKFQKLLIKLGIQHIKSRTYHPQTLGKIESFWRNLHQEFLSETPVRDFDELQDKLKIWIEYYNNKRVHQGICNLVPADRYQGFSKQITQVIEDGIKENAKQLEINPSETKPSMYLIGRIGEKEIRVIAKEGSVVIQDYEKAEKKVESEPVLPTLQEAATKTGEVSDGGQVSSGNQCNGETGNNPGTHVAEKDSGGNLFGEEHNPGNGLSVAKSSEYGDKNRIGAEEPGTKKESAGNKSGTNKGTDGAGEGTGEKTEETGNKAVPGTGIGQVTDGKKTA